MAVLPSFLIFLSFFSAGSAIRDALDEEFPFQVSIKTLNRRHLCGGAIITSRWVLTASSCLGHMDSVLVSFGTVDSNSPLDTISSERIVFQSGFNVLKKNRLALIRLKNDIQFGKTVSQAKLPTEKAGLRNTTKLSGWDVKLKVDVFPSLVVVDRYFVIPEKCYLASGFPIQLAVDEFCGIDDEGENNLVSVGSIVSKKEIVLGVLAQPHLAPVSPVIFVQMSYHDQWIKDVLGNEAQHVTWVDSIPKDSAPSQQAVSLTLMGICSFFKLYLTQDIY